jgi:hypothetical protein
MPTEHGHSCVLIDKPPSGGFFMVGSAGVHHFERESPLLTGKFFPDWTEEARLQKAGLTNRKRIRGKVLVCDGHFHQSPRLACKGAL